MSAVYNNEAWTEMQWRVETLNSLYYYSLHIIIALLKGNITQESLQEEEVALFDSIFMVLYLAVGMYLNMLRQGNSLT